MHIITYNSCIKYSRLKAHLCLLHVSMLFGGQKWFATQTFIPSETTEIRRGS